MEQKTHTGLSLRLKMTLRLIPTCEPQHFVTQFPCLQNMGGLFVSHRGCIKWEYPTKCFKWCWILNKYSETIGLHHLGHLLPGTNRPRLHSLLFIASFFFLPNIANRENHLGKPLGQPREATGSESIPLRVKCFLPFPLSWLGLMLLAGLPRLGEGAKENL